MPDLMSRVLEQKALIGSKRRAHVFIACGC